MIQEDEIYSFESDEEDDRLLATHGNEFEQGFDFVLTPHLDRRVRRLGVHHRNYVARLVQRGGGGVFPRNERQILPRQIDQALQRAIRTQVLNDPEVRPDDHLLININSNRLRHSYHSARLRVRDWQENTLAARQIMEQIGRMLNSNEQFRMDDSFSLHVSHIRDPGRGGGNKRLRKGSAALEKLLDVKKSVVKIKNLDELCCARAIVTIKAFHDLGCKHQDYQNLQKGFPMQKEKAQELHRAAGVPEGSCGLSEIQQFQDHLSEYQIVVLSVDHGYQIIFKGPTQPKEKQIVLIKVGEHFHGCHSLAGFLGRGYFCLDCEKSFDHDDMKDHPCSGKKCRACHQTECPDYHNTHGEAATLPCDRCHRSFFGPRCLENHYAYSTVIGKKANPSEKIKNVCATQRKCPTCRRLLRPSELKTKHECGTAECPSCKEYHNLQRHQCFIQNPKDLENKKKRKQRKRKADGSQATPEKETIFVHWDTETMQETGVHVPNLVCARTSNSAENYTFPGTTCIEDFLEWLRELCIDCKLVTMAHNSQGFDSYFILDKLYRQGICPEQIVNGAKILSMSINAGDIVFKDSLCFFQMPLSAFPKAFGLTEQKKGFFPHFFNIPENQEYVGRIPARDYYDPDSMSPKRKAEFEEWYTERLADPEYIFDFQRELIEYCRSDVKLLQDGCEVFCKEFAVISGFNPMEKCLTIASACNLYYRMNCLQPRTLASEPIAGWYNQGKPHSHAALEWLFYLNRASEENRIAHARNGGERVITYGARKIYPDGLDELTRIAYEFNGCYWHGCPKCHPNRDETHRKLGDRSMRDVYEATQERVNLLRLAGYRVVTMWECEWSLLKKEDENVRSFVDSLELVTRLLPRDAFFGGRTNAVKLHHVAAENEKIHYVDFTSLYPWVNKNCLYPVGHPVISLEPEGTDISSYFGLVKCTILPPPGLYHPVLPYRQGGKLTFPLCRKCVEEEQPKPLTKRSPICRHTDKERCLTGTWCTPELKEAIKQGYIIQHVHEVWHFQHSSNTLFTSYVNTFLKMKQEASGWPSWVGDDVDKRAQYINNYEEKEGIRLDPDKIEKNPGRRSLAKMMLNSFWGKYGQQGNKSQVKAFTSAAEFYGLLNDDTREMQTLRVVSPEMVEVVSKSVEDADPVQVNINIFVACFTTCWARLKLYQEGLSQLEPDQVLYFDTDSIIYSCQEGQKSLPLGDYLGEFTDELEDDDHIVEFASAGPKNYGYRTVRGKVECKVRGFSLNTRGREQLNFEFLKENVIREVSEPLSDPREIPVFNPHKITRDVSTKQLETLTEIKRYRLVFDKRVVDTKNYFSYPYGYLRYDEEEEEMLEELNVAWDEQDDMNVELLCELMCE